MKEPETPELDAIRHTTPTVGSSPLAGDGLQPVASQDFFLMRRRPSPRTPARPVPIKIMLVGSGITGEKVGVIKTEMLPAPTESRRC